MERKKNCCFSLFLSALVFASRVSICLSADENSERSFSLFSVVSFPNDECVTTMSTDMNGICQTQEKCTNSGGTASGNCASGFGVCCFVKVDACGSTVTRNITYIQNANYPTAITTASTNCEYKVEGAGDICQIRLDFDTAVLTQPAATGACVDSFQAISPTSYSPPTICGTFSGTHMYVETGRLNPAATIRINTGVGTAERKWKIKVTTIECSNPNRAPTDCVQYYSDTNGRIKSFNSPTQMITNQNYDVCIRQVIGFCSIDISETFLSTATTKSFQLKGTGVTSAQTGTLCTLSYISLRTGLTTDRYCGGFLGIANTDAKSSTITSNVTPFRMRVFATGDVTVDSKGFDLLYAQKSC